VPVPESPELILAIDSSYPAISLLPTRARRTPPESSKRLEIVFSLTVRSILLGSRHSANALRLREFLSRNGYPYRYVDLDADNTSQELLDRFEVTPSEIPVVTCSGRSVLRNLPIKNSLIVGALLLGALVRLLASAGASHQKEEHLLWKKVLSFLSILY
jgi:hypothetical protein